MFVCNSSRPESRQSWIEFISCPLYRSSMLTFDLRLIVNLRKDIAARRSWTAAHSRSVSGTYQFVHRPHSDRVGSDHATILECLGCTPSTPACARYYNQPPCIHHRCCHVLLRLHRRNIWQTLSTGTLTGVRLHNLPRVERCLVHPVHHIHIISTSIPPPHTSQEPIMSSGQRHTATLQPVPV